MRKNIYVSFLLTIFFSFHCGVDPASPPTHPISDPIVIVVGYDVSASFQQHPPLDFSFFESLVRQAITYDREIIIIVGIIGNPSKAPLLRWHHKPPVSESPSGNLRQRAYEAESTRLAQKKAVENAKEFLDSCEILYNTDTRHVHTDITGFFNKAKRIFNEPTFENARKFLVMYTDGFHDIEGVSRMDCDFSGINKLDLCVVGWSNSQTCINTQLFEFESINGLQYFLLETIKP
jgi:hypothetical protein